MNYKIIIYIFSFFIGFYTVGAQKPYFQVQASGGYTLPLMDMQEADHFCGDGWNGNLGFGMFFGKFGIMARGGYQHLAASPSFKDFVGNKYKDNVTGADGQNWRNAFGMIGPVVKFSFGKLDADIFAQIGMSKLTVPSLVYTRRFFGQQTEIANYAGQNQELIPFWTTGLSLHYRVSRSVGVYVEPSFLTNQFLSNTATVFRYVNAHDINNNGFIDDVEFTEAEIVKDVRDVVFSNLNINVGISYQLGRTEKVPVPVSMITLEEDFPAQKELEKTQPESKNEKAAQAVQKPEGSAMKQDAKNDVVMVGGADKISSSQDSVAEKAKYDESEARFLYKAGELYFQNTDFENAVACFNKLKNNPDYLMAKYMFALSMCEMMNCEEAAKEFSDFEKAYTKDDAGVLYTVYKSHYEKCRKGVAEQQALVEKLNAEKEAAEKEKTAVDKSAAQVNATTEKVDSKPSSSAATNEYKIQFVALKISNKAFPRMENIGTIGHEYFPKKSMYRYTLGPYTSEDEAVSDMLKVRAMGFEDAFLAVYKNGARTNTLYHAR